MNNCAFEHEESIGHLMCQMAGKSNCFILSNACFYSPSLTIVLECGDFVKLALSPASVITTLFHISQSLRQASPLA